MGSCCPTAFARPYTVSPWPPGLPTLAVVAVLIFKREIYGHHIISTADGYKNVTM